jgi:hypothetical protein
MSNNVTSTQSTQNWVANPLYEQHTQTTSSALSGVKAAAQNPAQPAPLSRQRSEVSVSDTTPLLGDRNIEISETGHSGVMAFLNNLREAISGFFNSVAEKFAGLFSSANTHTVSQATPAQATPAQPSVTGYEITKMLMLDKGKEAISHLDNLRAEIKTLQKDNGGLTAKDIVGFVREGQGSNANLRMVTTNMSFFNGNQLLRTGPDYCPDDKPFFQEIGTAFETKGNKLYELKKEMTDLLETTPLVEGLDIAFQSCASTTEKELQEKLDAVEGLTNEKLGEAFLTRLNEIKAAYENNIDDVEHYLESIKN